MLEHIADHGWNTCESCCLFLLNHLESFSCIPFAHHQDGISCRQGKEASVAKSGNMEHGDCHESLRLLLRGQQGREKRQVLPRAVIWNMGTAMRAFDSSSGVSRAASFPSFMQAPTLRCVCTTPLGKPVLPEVYMIMASSSKSMFLYDGRGNCLPAAITSSQAAWAPVSSFCAAVPRTMIDLTPSPPRNGWHTCKRSGSPISTFISESFTAYSNSSVFQSEFRGTATPPM